MATARGQLIFLQLLNRQHFVFRNLSSSSLSLSFPTKSSPLTSILLAAQRHFATSGGDKGGGGGGGGKKSKGFIDRIYVTVKGGHGGQGNKTRKASGGAGGSVIFIADSKVGSLSPISELRKIEAPPGAQAKRSGRISDGQDLIVQVPVGTVVLTQGQQIADLDNDGDSILTARGGEGGNAQTHKNWHGLPGEALNVTLEIKSIADVGLVGYPNAGKSSILKALSNSSPKIASYPFTTIRPNVGVVEYSDLFRFKLADIPGLIDGASLNRGMGHQFLRHVERTKGLLFVVDINGFQLDPEAPHRDASDTLKFLTQELMLYKTTLLERPVIIAVNKMDTPDAEAHFQALLQKGFAPNLRIQAVIPISTKSGQGLKELRQELRQMVTVALKERAHVVNGPEAGDLSSTRSPSFDETSPSPRSFLSLENDLDVQREARSEFAKKVQEGP